VSLIVVFNQQDDDLLVWTRAWTFYVIAYVIKTMT